MTVGLLVCILETRITEHQQIHDYAQRKGVGFFCVVWSFLIDFGRGVHASSRNIVSALVFNFASESVVCKPYDIILIQQNVFRFEIVVRETEVFEPK